MKQFDHSGHSSAWLIRTWVLSWALFATSTAAQSIDDQDIKRMEVAVAIAVQEGDFDRALALMMPFAEKGNPDVQHAVGIIIAGGQAPKEAREASPRARESMALPWIRKAAVGGNRQSMSWLADGYKWGRFNLPIDSKREQCWRKAAVGGGSPTLCE